MATEPRDYYAVLGVPKDADAKAIKDAFRELTLKYHPDRNKSPDAEERFKEIAEAYAVLSDPKKRADYDARGFAGVAGFTPEDLFSNIDFGDIFGDSGFGFDFGGGFFSDLFGRHRRPSGPRKGQDLEVSLVIPLDKVNSGGEETVHFNRPITCPDCHGTGAKPGTEPRTCSACQGTGKRVTTRQENREGGNVRFQQVTTCPVCHGQGVIVDHPCPTCHGSGEVEKEDHLKVKIPAGVEEGTALRIPGHGLSSADPKGPPGDLYVLIRSQPDARFERHGADLWRVEHLTVPQAVLGAKIQVPTLSGSVEVKVPPGSQPDEVLRLKGKGLPVFGSNMRGDINLRLQVVIPAELSVEAQALYEQLRQLESGSGHSNTEEKRDKKKGWWF